MALTPGALLPWIERKFLTTTGLPLAGGKLYSYVAGTVTPLATYKDSALSVANANPIILSAEGVLADPVFLLPTGYKFNLTNSLDVQQPNYPIDNVEEVGQTFASIIGVLYGTARTVTNNQTQAVADRLIFVNSSAVNPTIFNLLAANQWGNLLIVKNIGTNPVSITPNGSNTIEAVNAVFTLPAASGTSRPTVILSSDGAAGISIVGAFKVP